MSNFVYTKAKEAILNGQINFGENNFKILFTNSNYTADQSLNEFVSDIESSSIVYRSDNLTNVSNINGIIDADDLSFTLSSNIDFNSIILFQSKNSDQESRLIAHIDEVAGLPYIGSSEPLSAVIVWSNLSGKILSI
jgi:hypothetical protein